jgi:hypothetical protein
VVLAGFEAMKHPQPADQAARWTGVVRRFFPADRLGKSDLLMGGMVLLFCSAVFYHGDLIVTGINAFNYLQRPPGDFYEHCLAREIGAYPPTVYALFAAVLLPLHWVGWLTGPGDVPGAGVYAMKLLTTLAYIGTALVFYRVTAFYGTDLGWRRFAAWVFLTSPLALYSQFIFSQHDIFYVFCTVAGFWLFLRGQLLAASLIFGIGITFKQFPAFVFLPLLLLGEKRPGKLVLSVVIFALPTALLFAAYRHSPAFVESVINHPAAGRIWEAALQTGGWRLSYLIAGGAVLCCWAYVRNRVDDEAFRRDAAYIFLAGSILPFLFIVWHPQWLIFITPAVALTSMTDSRWKQFLALDLAAMAFFVAAAVLTFSNLDHGLVQVAVPLFSGTDPWPMASFLTVAGAQSTHLFATLFWSYLLANIVLKKTVAAPAPHSADGGLSYDNIRLRFLAGLGIFLIPLALSSQANNFSNFYRVTNDSRGVVFGELSRGRVFEQSFTARRGHLASVSLAMGTYARSNHGQMVVEVVDRQGRTLASKGVELAGLADNSWCRVPIRAKGLQTGQTYLLRATCPDAAPGHAPTWWASPDDGYPDGQAVVDGVAQPRDFSFMLEFK